MKFYPFLAMSLVVFATGCASHTVKHETTAAVPVPQEIKAASALDRSVVSKINFTPGQNGLSADAASTVQKAIADARNLGQIKNVEIVAWSDQEYPMKGKKLSSSQINLAKERAKNVEKLIDQVAPSSSVKTFNMAKQPNAFQKWVATRDARVKEQLAASGIHDDSARASSALLFIEVK